MTAFSLTRTSDLPLYLDTADWVITAVFTDPVTGDPMDLTSSLLRVSFATIFDNEPVAMASTEAGVGAGTIDITDPTGGEINISIPVGAKPWRVPSGNRGPLQPITLVGHVLRRPGSQASDIVEWTGKIFILVERGSTEWPTS